MAAAAAGSDQRPIATDVLEASAPDARTTEVQGPALDVPAGATFTDPRTGAAVCPPSTAVPAMRIPKLPGVTGTPRESRKFHAMVRRPGAVCEPERTRTVWVVQGEVIVAVQRIGLLVEA